MATERGGLPVLDFVDAAAWEAWLAAQAAGGDGAAQGV